jgi:uncharacterized CHY-type Zn-finger protein
MSFTWIVDRQLEACSAAWMCMECHNRLHDHAWSVQSDKLLSVSLLKCIYVHQHAHDAEQDCSAA